MRVEALLLLALVAALGVIAWLMYDRASYRAHHKWSDEDVKAARRESINRSLSVVSGRVQEHLAPLLPQFIEEFNPKDARFLGTPVDFVVFDGLDDGEVKRVCLVEVKTGRSSLTSRERGVRRAIDAGSVSFQTIRLPGAEALPSDVELESPVPDARPALQP